MRLCAALFVFLAGIGAAVHGEEAKVWRVGFLSPYSPEWDAGFRAGFREGMRERGYVEGKNLVIDMRHAEGAFERYPRYMRELLALKPDVIVAHGSSAVAAAKATSTTPIVFVAHPDPVGDGVVASLARPGGNVTGLSDLHSALGAKRIELLKQIVPQAARVGVLLDPTVAIYRRQLEELLEAASALHVRVLPFHIRGPADIPGAFEAMRRERIDGLHVLGGSAGIHLGRVVELAVESRIPTIATNRKSTEEGILASYGANFPDLYRRAALYVDKIFKGAKPADLPVDLPTTFELGINMKTAAAIGVSIAPVVLQRADFVIR